jgi:hypothetical protein
LVLPVTSITEVFCNPQARHLGYFRVAV